MHSLRRDVFLDHPPPLQLVQTLRLLGESKGRQQLYRRQSPQILEVLRKAAVIESTRSSNRIEGIVASDERVEALVEGATEPRNRSEQEIAGYRSVLATLHSSHDDVPFTSNVVLQLHRDLYRFAPQEGGRYKAVDNEITETDAEGNRALRFRPTSAFETPRAMEELHRRYDALRATGEVEPLLLIASYALDFLCIHPFLDGNGRMARLLTLLLLYKEGYEVGRFISLERTVERQRDGYYDALYRSSQGWHEGEHDPLPWWEYFLGVMLLEAYREARAAGRAHHHRTGCTERARGKHDRTPLGGVQDLRRPPGLPGRQPTNGRTGDASIARR